MERKVRRSFTEEFKREAVELAGSRCLESQTTVNRYLIWMRCANSRPSVTVRRAKPSNLSSSKNV